MAKFQVNFPFKIRQAMQVANAVAEEVVNNSMRHLPFGKRREHEVRPILLSIRGIVPTFHFEGGVVVKVHMVDLDQFKTKIYQSLHMEDWVVTHCEVRYYQLNTDWYIYYIEQEKISEVWEADKLLALKSARPWRSPSVKDLREIKGIVGVFVDNVTGRGYISVDPKESQEGCFRIYRMIKYARFIEGDLERAKTKAREILEWMLISER